MQYEAQNIFLALDDLNQAARYKRVKPAEKSYVKLALAYDRFLKAGGLVTYDPITSTEPFYSSIPDSDLLYGECTVLTLCMHSALLLQCVVVVTGSCNCSCLVMPANFVKVRYMAR
jgi:hypothetical protein